MANELTQINWMKGAPLTGATLPVPVDQSSARDANASVSVQIRNAHAMSRVDLTIALEAIEHALMAAPTLWRQA